MTETLSKTDWLTIGLSFLGALWLAIICSGFFDVVIRWLYANLKRIRPPDYVPEDWTV